MIMIKSNCLPTEPEYVCLEQPDQPTHTSPFHFASEKTVWNVVRYDNFDENTEDEADIRDSIEALKDPHEISLDDLKRDLGL
jgi:hypothetical protein